MTIDMDNYV
ncbi:hypothetical protein AYI70_g5572, partial [Smittium culicis]